MMNHALLKGTQTEKNLAAAFAGESQARNRYSYYAEIAKTEALGEAEKFFETMSRNEMFHAKQWYKLLNGGKMPNVIEALEEAIKGENHEQSVMYPEFAATAEKEGFPDIAELFKQIASIEAAHEAACKKLLESLKNSAYMFEIQNDMVCMACGFDFRERDQLEACPVCGKSSEHFAHQL